MTEPLPFDAVLWDIDGTLANSEPVHQLSLEIACRDLDLPWSSDIHTALIGVREEASYAWLASEIGLSLAFDDWVERRCRTYLDVVDKVRFHPDVPAMMA